MGAQTSNALAEHMRGKPVPAHELWEDGSSGRPSCLHFVCLNTHVWRDTRSTSHTNTIAFSVLLSRVALPPVHAGGSCTVCLADRGHRQVQRGGRLTILRNAGAQRSEFGRRSVFSAPACPWTGRRGPTWQSSSSTRNTRMSNMDGPTPRFGLPSFGRMFEELPPLGQAPGGYFGRLPMPPPRKADSPMCT